MKRFNCFLILIGLIMVLSACGQSEVGFRGNKWGSSIEEVINNEKSKGNELYNTVIDDNEIIIEYEDMIVNGHIADVEFIFKNEINKNLILLSSEVLVEDDLDDFLSLPEEIKFNDFILVEGNYYFRDIDEEDTMDIFNSLVSKYGEQEFIEGESTRWIKNGTHIYFDNEDYVSYNADYQVIKKFMKTNRNNSNDF